MDQITHEKLLPVGADNFDAELLRISWDLYKQYQAWPEKPDIMVQGLTSERCKYTEDRARELARIYSIFKNAFTDQLKKL